jgi:alpha-D-xyloside xylohydrolase
MNKKQTMMMMAMLTVAVTAQTTPVLVDTTMKALQVLEWKQRAPGVWSAMIGKAEISPMDFAGSPKLDALKELGDPALPARMTDARGQVQGVYASVRLPITEAERLYGLGMRADGDVNLRLRDFYLRVTPHSHAPTPFYISSEGYGVLINAARVVHIQMGIGNRKDSPNHPAERDRTTDRNWSSRPQSDAVEASVAGTGMEIMVFAGKTPLEVMQRYNLFCGGGCLPPRWGLGFWHRILTTASSEQVVQEVEEFAKRDIPLDVIGLEPGWQSAAYPCTYEWDPVRYPDPAGFMKGMTSKGISINLWENLFVSKKAPIYAQLAPYTGSHTYWLGEIPDYTFKAARDIFLAQHQCSQLALGVSGYKIDEVDELSAEHMLFPSGICGEQMRQIHGLIMQKAYMETFRSLNRRTCGLVRGSNAGGSPYPFALYSDTYEHRGFIQALANSSLAGVLWCSEVRDGQSDEDWVRRFQTGLFSPIMQLNAWSSGLKPWSKPGATDQVRELLKMRVRLLPYLYTTMADYQRYGTPPIRHMLLEEGAVEVSDQYMFGPNILVAPMIAGEKSRKVVLPKGKWFDFHTGKLAGEERTITVSATLDQIPLFVRDGGIIPLMAAANNIRLATGPTPLEVRHYGTQDGTYQLYDDDGETFDYEKGISSRQELRVVRDNGKLKGETLAPKGPWKSRFTTFTWRFMTE